MKLNRIIDFKLIRSGITRDVILINKYAIKIPTIKYGIRFFALGWLSNIQEFEMSKDDYWIKKSINPTIFSFIGLFNIQKRVEILDRELNKEEYNKIKKITIDIKPDNCGYINNIFVIVDYANIKI